MTDFDHHAVFQLPHDHGTSHVRHPGTLAMPPWSLDSTVITEPAVSIDKSHLAAHRTWDAQVCSGASLHGPMLARSLASPVATATGTSIISGGAGSWYGARPSGARAAADDRGARGGR